MNSISNLNVILLKMEENAPLFEKSIDLTNLVYTLCKIGNVILKKSLPCFLLNRVLKILNEIHKSCVIDNDVYKHFLTDVNNFYKCETLCPTYKLGIILCYAPAVELELLTLLKLCSNISKVEELYRIRSAVGSSVLIQACQKSEKTTLKVVSILKNAFFLSEGNPVLGYLTFHLYNSIAESSIPDCFLSNELYYLDMCFNFPFHLFLNDEQELLFKKLIESCVEAVNLNLCTKQDLIFCMTVFPTCFQRMLELGSSTQTSNFITEFLKFLYANEKHDFLEDINQAKENSVWKFL